VVEYQTDEISTWIWIRGYKMNERIKQLAEQAREFATTRHPVSNIVLSVNSEKFEEKFAELIVLECAVIVGSMEEPHQDIAKLIKQHFGVEE
jgi:hypothetical protein